MSTTGKGHAVIPAFTFFRDRTGDEEEKHTKRGKMKTDSNDFWYTRIQFTRVKL